MRRASVLVREAFKRLKHRFNLAHISGLPQQAVAQDVAAKIVCDSLQAFVSLTAHADADLLDHEVEAEKTQGHEPEKLLKCLNLGGLERTLAKLRRNSAPPRHTERHRIRHRNFVN